MTAVEFLNEQLGNILELYPSEWEKINKVYEEAKEMEKQQIIDAFDECGNWQDKYSDAEHYYNETYKKP